MKIIITIIITLHLADTLNQTISKPKQNESEVPTWKKSHELNNAAETPAKYDHGSGLKKRITLPPFAMQLAVGQLHAQRPPRGGVGNRPP